MMNHFMIFFLSHGLHIFTVKWKNVTFTLFFTVKRQHTPHNVLRNQGFLCSWILVFSFKSDKLPSEMCESCFVTPTFSTSSNDLPKEDFTPPFPPGVCVSLSDNLVFCPFTSLQQAPLSLWHTLVESSSQTANKNSSSKTESIL